MRHDLAAGLSQLISDPLRVLTEPAVLDRLSHDFYWYSPILRPLLAAKNGDIAVLPVSIDEILAILRFAGLHCVPVTVRGAGTGNYGQCVPLEGGIVLDLSLMDKLEAITPDGVAVCQPGLRLGALETDARKHGWELRMYPSTLVKASVGGFLGGGSGGIGSVTHGGLRDFDNVRAFEFVTMEDPPRVVHHEGAAIHEILHAWGTNGILTRIWFALTPAVDWVQVTIAFDTYLQAFRFTQSIAVDPAWTKRLATVFEWPIPSFFTPIKEVTRIGKALALMMIAASQADALRTAARAAGGEITFSGAYDGPRTRPLLSDYTWNHTTLWAMKADPAYTYLQCGFSPTHCEEQFHLLRDRYGDEILFHIEFMKNGDGVVIPGAIPIVRFTTEDRLNEMIAYCRSIGVFVANPHVNHLEDGGRYRPDNIQLLAKQKYDPRGLLNPGKMIGFRRPGDCLMKTWIPDARNFAYLTWKQVDALSRETTLLVLPTAAIEQHGHHLPLATDTLINNLLLGKALALVPSDLSIYALPPVCYGKSNEHIGFPGTLSVSAQTFMAVVRDLGASIASAGFKKLVLYNTHGGNTSLVDVLARDLRAEFDLRTFTIFGSPGAKFSGLSDQERAYGFHAGEIETAYLLHATPDLVHPAEYSANYIARIEQTDPIKPEGSSANFAWLTRDIAPSGVLGDPSAATAENGERWSNEAAARIAELLVAMYEFRPRHGA